MRVAESSRTRIRPAVCLPWPRPTCVKEATALLIDARRALATGDARRAATLVEQAKAMNIAYGFHDDSPAKVEALIRKSAELTEIDGNRPATEAARRQRAEFLMEQSEQLLRWRAYDEAERLANDAITLRATFGPFDANPQALRDRIVAERKKQPPRTLPARPAGGEMAGGGSPLTPPTVAEDAATLLAAPSPAEAKKQALELTKMARSALAQQKIDLADRLARQAEALQVPSTAFGPQEDRPALVILEVAKLRQQNGSYPSRGQRRGRAEVLGRTVDL